MLGSKEQRTKGMKVQAQELIDQAYERGFKAGREDAVGAGDVAYQRGLDDAWEAVRKIMRMGSTKQEIIFGCHGDLEILERTTASEAIERIRQYEEQKKAEEEKVKIGDEVVGKWGFRGVVVGIDLPSNKASVLSAGYAVPQMYPLNDIIKKTERHFPQIAEVLKQLREGE